VALASPFAYGQGASSATSLSGVVVDKDGGVIPGATVEVKNNATGVATTVVTNAQGAWSLPALATGTYTVSVSLQGFKTFVHTEVRLLSATPATLRSTLEIGALTETVEVRGGTELVRLETPTVSSTVSAEFIRNLPRADRNALNFLTFLPGVQTNGANARGSTISGLPQNTINITIDGVSNSNNLQSGDGFFSMVVPRLDAIEEVTLTTSTSGVDSSGQGATQVRFVTRSGTNTFNTSIYEYFRHKSLNTNTFFNRLAGLPRPRVTISNYGGRVGGPIVIPGLFDGRGKAFFFFNHEETWQPNQLRRTRTIIKEGAALGNFTWNVNSPRTVNVLQLAAANGQISAMDPNVQSILSSILAVSKTTGTVESTAANLNTDTYNFLTSVASVRHSPTTRVDINLTNRHRLSGSYYWQGFSDTPDTLNNADPTFPGFPAQAGQTSFRTTGSASLRSTFSSNIVNELRGGWQWSPVKFFEDANASMFENQGGYALNLGFPVSPNNSNITNAHPGNSTGPQSRNTINWNIDNNLNWLKGNHTMSMGFSFTRIDNWIDNWNTIQSVNLGFNTANDPAAGIFNTTNFPTASANDLNNARSLYALLTGRISSLPGTARLDNAGAEYIFNGLLHQAEYMDEYGLFIQDSWRWKPNVTITAGLRYELQKPMVARTSNYAMSTLEDLCGPSGLGDGPLGRQCNMFNPGVFNNPGQVPTYVAYDAGNPGYNTDYNNFGPAVGVSWRPNVQQGWLRQLLGDPDQATVSAGFTRTFNRERVDRFRSVFANNPGATLTATRGTAAGNYPLVPAGESWPLLYSQRSRLAQPDFPRTPSFPITASLAGGQDIRIFDPEIEVPYTDQWSMGVQRGLGRDMAVEVRYIGNKNKKPWNTENWNVENIYETGFLDEFKVAQANLQANTAAGRGGSFAYFGPGTGTSPLPIYFAHFTGQPTSQAGNAALYPANRFTDSGFVDDLDAYFPDPYGAASSLRSGNSGLYRTNAAAAGLPDNFFVMNPLVDDAVVTRNLGGSNYHSIQVDLRRRFSKGLQVQGSYTWARQSGLSNEDLHLSLFNRRTANVPHALKMLWVYEIPVGRGKRFGTDMNPWLNGVVGGWEFSGAGRSQIPLFRLTNTQLVGMTKADAQKAFKQTRFVIDPASGATTVWDMPQDIIDNTRRAYNTDPTSPTGYPAGEEPTGRYFAPAGGPGCFALYPGDCAADLFFYGKFFTEFDFKLAKKFQFASKGVAEVNIEVFNALNSSNFTRQLNPGNGANIFRITGQQSGARIGQIVWRVSW